MINIVDGLNNMPILLSIDPLSIFLGILVIVFLWKSFQSNGNAAVINKLPGPTAYPLVGNIVELLEPREKSLDNFIKRHKKYGHIFRLWAGLTPIVVFSNPKHIEVLLKSSKNSEKSMFYNYLHPWLGTGLLTSHGQKWITHRKLITPTFHFKVLQSFISVFHDCANILVNKLKEKEKTGEEFDIYPFVTLCALDIICETAMGTKINAQSEANNQYVQSTYSLSELVVRRMNRPWLHPDFMFKNTKTGKEFEKHLDIVQGFTEKVIKNRKEALKIQKETEQEKLDTKKLTFLDLLLESSMQSGAYLLTDVELREEVDTFMFEGHDTTAAGITWALCALGKYPKIQEECYRELETIFENDPDRVPTLADLSEMKLLERVIKEALRLYPSVLSIGRIIEEDMHFDDYLVPKGTNALIAIFGMHRNAELYPNPDVFDPDRFLPENIQKRHPYAYIPFSAGPRNCIGQKFALFEEKVVLSTLIRKYKFESLKSPEETTKTPDLVLRPKNGIRMKITRRQ